MVRLKYVPRKDAPRHLKQVFRLGAAEFHAGKPQTVPADFAGEVIAAAPPDSIVVLDGKPAEPKPALPASADKRMREIEERTKAFPVDPARSLHGLPQLPAGAASVLLGKNGVRAVKKGDYDAILPLVGMFCWIAGATDAAEAAARRAVTLHQDANKG